MGTPAQFDHDVFRILLYRNDATEILLEINSDGLRIPSVLVPAHSRIAEEITAAIRSGWNLQTVYLFTLPLDGLSHDPIHYQVVESCRLEPTPPAGMQWHPVLSLSVDNLQDPEDSAAIQNSLTTLDRYQRGELPGVFGKTGWLRMVTEWVEKQAATAGLRLTGEFRQLNASPTFNLTRFETDGPTLWFKAVGEPNLHEYRVTLKLASLFPGFLPQILGTRLEWNAWLALAAEGCQLDANSANNAWAAAAENLALLQISSFGRRFELIKAGCKDLRPCSLMNLVDLFLDAMTELMERQTKPSPAPLSRKELFSLGRDISSALQQIGECAIPNTLGHLDMNPGNVLVCGTHCTFLDWAEAYIGPPFFSFQYLLEHFRRIQGGHWQKEKLLVASYARHWTRFASARQINAAFRLMPLLAAFAYGVGIGSWRNRESFQPQSARHLRSLTRRMKCEADSLQERRLTCVP
jgi:hypothetical protein